MQIWWFWWLSEAKERGTAATEWNIDVSSYCTIHNQSSVLTPSYRPGAPTSLQSNTSLLVPGPILWRPKQQEWAATPCLFTVKALTNGNTSRANTTTDHYELYEEMVFFQLAELAGASCTIHFGRGSFTRGAFKPWVSSGKFFIMCPNHLLSSAVLLPFNQVFDAASRNRGTSSSADILSQTKVGTRLWNRGWSRPLGGTAG